MKYMTFKNRYILLIFIISICFSALSKAQTPPVDSVNNKQNLIKNIALGTQPAWMVTSATSAINGSDLNRSFTSNFANTLSGRLPGLTVLRNSSEPGSDSPVLYGRGVGTFGTGKNLLVIVDGFESMFEQLVPEEVESVTLLKDASATAVYGSRGANGVLLITTKRGTEGPLKVNFSAQQGFESARRLPDFLGSYDFARLYNEGSVNDGNAPKYSDSDLEAYRTGSDPYFYPDVNWYDKVLRKSAPVSEYDLSFSGGQKKAKYFVLLNVLNRYGLYKKTGDLSDFSSNSKYGQYNIRTNIDIDLTKNLLVTFDLGVSIADKANPVNYNTASLFDLISSVPPNAFPVYAPNNAFGGNALYTNPWGDMLQTGFYTSNYRTIQSRLKFTEKLDMITKGLSASGAISFNNSFRGYSSKSRTYKRFSISKDALGNTVYLPFGVITSLSSAETQFDQWRNFSFQTLLNYNRTFDIHKVDAMLGYDLNTYTLSGNSLPYKHIGLNGRFTYANREKYIGEFSFGYYGSENFMKGKRFGFFPAVSLGWITSNEEFLKGNNVINYLKIRGSYGMVGNDNIGGQRFMYNQYYVGTSSYYYGTANTSMGGYAEGYIANPDVTWEKEKEINFGFEAVVLHNVEVGFDLFLQDRYDILASPNSTVPQFLGLTLPSLNVGKVNNKGFEAKIGYNSNKSKDLQFFVDANVWYAKNKIVYNAETIQRNEYQNATGRSIGQPFVLEALGFFKDQADIDNSPQQIFAKVQPGDIKYKDQNNDGIVDQNDYFPIGKSSIPELTLGLHTGLRYKSFDLDLFFQGVANRSVYLSGEDFYAFQSDGKISSLALGRWTTETASTATYPRLSAQNNLNNYQPSSFWQRNGSFVKLRSVELGFNFSDNIVRKIHVDNARIFINATDLFSLDHMKGLTDPEILTGYPAVRSLSLGAKIQF
jgi:TonB-linked SusC/RagA family outer membrane protein